MNPDGFHIPSLDQALAALDGSPVGLYLIPAIALIAGAFLWAAGGRALKPLFIIAAAAAGAALGAARLTPILAQHIHTFPPQYAALGFGALGGILLAVAFFRAVMGLAAAVTLAAVAFIIAAASMGLDLSDFSPREASPSSTAAADLYERAVVVYGRAPGLAQSERTKTARPPRRPDNPDHSDNPQAAAALEYSDTAAAPPSATQALRDRAGRVWSSLPARARYNLSAAALAGAVLGLVIGVLAPRKSAALVTAALGAGLMLFAAVGLINTLEADHTAAKLLAVFNQRGPAAWLIAWSALAFLGLAIQSHRTRKPAPAASH